MSDEPEIARTLAACVQQHIAFGERAGQQVRRIGSGFGYAGEHPVRTDTRCASVNGFSLHANTQAPAHWRAQLERLEAIRKPSNTVVAILSSILAVMKGGATAGSMSVQSVPRQTTSTPVKPTETRSKALQLFPGLITLVPHIYVVRQELEA